MELMAPYETYAILGTDLGNFGSSLVGEGCVRFSSICDIGVHHAHKVRVAPLRVIPIRAREGMFDTRADHAMGVLAMGAHLGRAGGMTLNG